MKNSLLVNALAIPALLLGLACAGGHSDDGPSPSPEPIEAPIIVSQSFNKAIAAGKEVAFSVVARANPAPTYSWESKAPNGNWQKITWAKGEMMGFIVSGLDDHTIYHCRVANSQGETVSRDMVLTINGVGTLVWADQPSDVTANDGETVSFSASATGFPNPVYQWQYCSNGNDWYDLPLKEDAEVSFVARRPNSGMEFRLKAMNTTGVSYSNPATLTVK